MAIEFTHRATSGIALLSVLALYVWARRCFPQRSSARRAAFFSLIFMLNETLVGALLVLLGLVAGNRSPWRAAVLGLHLINTLLLLGSLTLTAWWSTHGDPGQWNQGRLKRLLLTAIVLIIALSATGGVAALGDTLFPAPSVSAGVQHEFSRSAPILVQLRVVHPVLAVLAGAYLLWLISHSLARVKSAAAERWGHAVTLFVLVQFVLGAMNILLLTPLWTQLTHLLITDLLWVSLVIFSTSILTATPRQKAA
jgi:cytochrome c oxidase assembly protein subunit 15/protoheme IX farnesyltransferase